jgi:hypothetical protein
MTAALAFLALTHLAVASESPGVPATRGSICIPGIARPTAGAKSLANPSGGGRTYDYAVQIDDRMPAKISFDDGVLIPDLAVGRKHSVVIRNQGRKVESVRFTFESKGDVSLCLWFKELYETWSLTPAKERGGSCSCAKAGTD